jgi:uncharacterized repeat protein (TIGR01451 family)
MKKILCQIGLLLSFALLLSSARPAHAIYPAPWPDAGGTVNSGWSPYTLLGTSIQDKPSATDNSTGGTTPTQDADFISNGSPSFYIAYSAVNQVLFIRMRLAKSALTPTPDGNSNDDPFDNVTWSMLIDSDGDGYKEFIVRLNGDTGGPGNAIDDLQVYYDNRRAQDLLAGAVPIWTVKSAVFPDSDPAATYVDFGRSRAIASPTPGVGDYLDFQVPLSAFTVNGIQLITATTPVSYAFGTSNSNTDPFQKDAGFSGDFTAAVTDPFPFGDPGTPGGGTTQNPYVTSLTTSGTCGTTTLSAVVLDTLDVSSGVVVSTIDNVKFYYQPDFNQDGVADANTTATLIGTAVAPSATDVTLWQVNWNNNGLVNGRYLLTAVATDKQGNSGTSAAVPFDQSCGGVGVTGTVYNDANHNVLLDNAETGTNVAGLFVKLKLASSGAASFVVAVTQSTGAFSFTGISAGTYSLILDNNSDLNDVTPFLPSGWIGTQNPTQQIDNVTVASNSISGQNFGLWNGSKVSGTVFYDTGSGGGIGNNGQFDGTETGISGVTVRVQNAAGSATYESTTTAIDGTYTLWIPAANAAQSLRVIETNLASTLSTGASTPGSIGTYNRAADTITWTSTTGTIYSGFNFGDVALNTFTLDNAATDVAGATAYHHHVFTANSAGTVSFSTTHIAAPANPDWSNVIYLDTNNGGTFDPGDTLYTGGDIVVTAGEVVSILVAEHIPLSAHYGDQDTITVTANFTYTNAAPALSATYPRTDLTTVGNTGDRLQLIKAVDKASAKPGETVTYTITYRNVTLEPLSNIVISDNTPNFTDFLAANNGTLPASLTGVSVAAPTVGTSGTITWTFTGTLEVGNSGTVTLQVKVR